MTTDIPSRNDGVTITCPVCGRRFQPSGRRRHCSDACRQAAWRRRHTPPTPQPPLPPKGHRRAATVYQCPSCDTRTLGQQRCDFAFTGRVVAASVGAAAETLGVAP